MGRKTASFAGIFAALTLSAGLFVQSAKAAPIVQVSPFDFGVVSFQSFDSSLGTLTSVELAWEGTSSQEVFDSEQLCTAFLDCDGTYFLSIVGNDAYSGVSDTDSQAVTNAQVDNGITVDLGISGLSSLPVGGFLGDGVTSVSTLEIDQGCDGDCFNSGGPPFFAGTVSLTYDYRGVPAPATLGLLGLGLLGLRLRRRA